MMRRLYDTAVKMWWVWPLCGGVAAYVLIMLLAAGQSVWFDEGYSIMVAQQPVGELLALTAVDAHPPLYYLLLKGWGELFAWNEFALRSLSALLAAGTVAAAFLLVRKLFGFRTALLTLPFLIVAPFLLRYGYEIRMYALAGFIGILATLVLVYALEAKRNIALWVAYAALVALGMYTLYLMLAVWVAHAVYLLVTQRRGLFKQPWVYALVGAVALFIPYTPILVNQMTNSALPGIGSQVTLTTVGGMISLALAYVPDWQQTGLLSAALLGIVALTVAGIVAARRALKPTGRRSLLLLVLLAAVPLAFFIAISILQSAFVYRYMAHVVAFIYLLLGVVVALGLQRGQPLRGALFALLSLVVLMSGVTTLAGTGNFVFERLQLPQTQAVRAVVECQDAVVVADDPYTFIDSQYYFEGCDERFYAPDMIVKRGGYAPLADSEHRLASADTLTAPTLYHLRWSGLDAQFAPDAQYTFSQSYQFDKQIVDVYTLNEE